MSEQDINKVIKERINDIFPDQLTASRIVDIVVTKKPPGWSKQSNASYYTEFYGKQMQKAADLMIADKEDKIFRYDTFCGKNEEVMSHISLYMRINQSRRFLCDYLDTPEKLYKDWFDHTRCEKKRGVGVIIHYIKGYADGLNGFLPESAMKEDERPNWRRRMEDWIESDEVKPFQQDNLILSPTEIVALKMELNLLVNIMAHVTSSCIKIVRTN